MLTARRRRGPARDRRRRRPRDEGGAIVVITALLTCFVLIVVAALTVDLGNVWARRGQLQSQADNAAIFAASYLPASQPASRLTAAKAAVHYIACNPVAGQEASVNSAFPIPRTSNGSFSCPFQSFDASQSTYTTAATTMMTTGKITFPNQFEIQVTTPWAKVQYGFGRAVGADDSLQQKTAAAHVYSPGNMVPMGGSLGCIAAAANNAQVGGIGDALSKVAPVNYFSAGDGTNSLNSSSGSSGTVTWPATPTTPPLPKALTMGTPTKAGTTLTVPFTQTIGPTGLTGAVFNTLMGSLIGKQVTVWFARGTSSGTTLVSATAPLNVLGSVSVTLPAAVQSSPGQWYVKVVVPFPNYTTTVFLGVPVYTATGTFTSYQSTDSRQIGVDLTGGLSDLTDLDNFLSCARPVLSPRNPTHGTSQDLIDNIRRGMDHSLGAHPALVTAASALPNLATTSVSNLVSTALVDPAKLALSCTGNAATVADDAAHSASAPNCVTVDTRSEWSKEFTAGFLTAQGRLSCAVTACTHGTFNGGELGLSGQYNNDTISDYVSSSSPQTVLNDLLFTSLDTMLTPSIPVLTPANQLSSAIYSSPRFFWTPVLTTVFANSGIGVGSTNAAYPILTFRPAFITQESPTPTALQKLINSLDAEIALELKAIVSGGITGTVLGNTFAQISANLTASISTSIGLSFSDLMTQLGADSHKKEKYGLVFDDSSPSDSVLKAVRVMNMNPGSLPAVNQDYSGPVSDYFGSGPKVIRLVR